MSIYSNDVIVEGTVDATGSAVSITNFPATQPISGSVSVSNFPATQPVSGTVSVGNVVSVITAVASTATLTVVTQPNNTDTVLLAPNANRKSAIIFLPKSGTAVAYDTTASATHFTYKTGASNTTIIVTGYTGAIHSFGSGDTINVTELV
jgi:hypothetical protein